MLPGRGVHAGCGISVTVDLPRVQPKGGVARRPITCSGRTKEAIRVAKVCAGRSREGSSGDWKVLSRVLGGAKGASLNSMDTTLDMGRSYVCLR